MIEIESSFIEESRVTKREMPLHKVFNRLPKFYYEFFDEGIYTSIEDIYNNLSKSDKEKYIIKDDKLMIKPHVMITFIDGKAFISYFDNENLLDKYLRNLVRMDSNFGKYFIEYQHRYSD